MSKRTFYAVLCAVSLTAGGCIYIVFRESSYIGDLSDNILIIKNIRKNLETFSNDIVKFYLPDFLWCLSLCLGLFAIFVPKYKCATFCAAIAFVCGVAWEILQYGGLIRGTGDIFDVITYLLAALIAILLFIIKEKKDEKN